MKSVSILIKKYNKIIYFKRLFDIGLDDVEIVDVGFELQALTVYCYEDEVEYVKKFLENISSHMVIQYN